MLYGIYQYQLSIQGYVIWYDKQHVTSKSTTRGVLGFLHTYSHEIRLIIINFITTHKGVSKTVSKILQQKLMIKE